MIHCVVCDEYRDDCKHPRVQLVTDALLENKAWLDDVHAFANRLDVPRRQMLDYMAKGFEKARVALVDEAGEPVYLDLREAEKCKDFGLFYRDWLRHRPGAPNIHPHTRERVRLIATMLRVIFWKEQSVWGRSLASLGIEAGNIDLRASS